MWIPQDLIPELIFVQFRKALEEIAFASLSANREKYGEVHANFATHWNAKLMLKEIEHQNPHFYPVPLREPTGETPGLRHFEPLSDGFLRQDEFVLLYNSASEALHSRNPYRADDPTIIIKYTVQDWVVRFQRLLSWHSVTLLSGDVWIVTVPSDGFVRAYPSTPTALV